MCRLNLSAVLLRDFFSALPKGRLFSSLNVKTPLSLVKNSPILVKTPPIPVRTCPIRVQIPFGLPVKL